MSLPVVALVHVLAVPAPAHAGLKKTRVLAIAGPAAAGLVGVVVHAHLRAGGGEADSVSGGPGLLGEQV